VASSGVSLPCPNLHSASLHDVAVTLHEFVKPDHTPTTLLVASVTEDGLHRLTVYCRSSLSSCLWLRSTSETPQQQQQELTTRTLEDTAGETIGTSQTSTAEGKPASAFDARNTVQ
jgi:hypothetical protein